MKIGDRIRDNLTIALAFTLMPWVWGIHWVVSVAFIVVCVDDGFWDWPFAATVLVCIPPGFSALAFSMFASNAIVGAFPSERREARLLDGVPFKEIQRQMFLIVLQIEFATIALSAVGVAIGLVM